MSKDNKFTLEVELARKPYSGFSFAKTRRRFTEELLKFEMKEGQKFFVGVSSFEITDEGSATMKVLVNPRVNMGMEKDAVTQESKLCDLIDMLETHLGISEDDVVSDELHSKGIIPAIYIKKFESEED